MEKLKEKLKEYKSLPDGSDKYLYINWFKGYKAFAHHAHLDKVVSGGSRNRETLIKLDERAFNANIYGNNAFKQGYEKGMLDFIDNIDNCGYVDSCYRFVEFEFYKIIAHENS